MRFLAEEFGVLINKFELESRDPVIDDWKLKIDDWRLMIGSPRLSIIFNFQSSIVNRDVSEIKIIQCRFCQSKNKIPFQAVFQNMQTAKCGRCHEGLFVAETAKLPKLTSKVYEHQFDTKALEGIQKIPGVDTILKTLIKESYERANRLFHKANTVAVTSKQLPRMYQLFLDAGFPVGYCHGSDCLSYNLRWPMPIRLAWKKHLW